MPVVRVYNMENEPIGEIELDDKVFDAEERAYCVHQMVRYQLCKRRRGTAKTKERSEVNYSTKKLYRQKGTGRARRGSARSPLLKGGGRVFGPKPRDFSFKLPKKVRRLALKSALSSKLREQALLMLDGVSLDEPKTKTVSQFLQRFGIDSYKVLIVTRDDDASYQNLKLGARNLPKVKTLLADGVNVYDVLNYQIMVMTVDAAKKLEEVYGK